MPFLIIGLGNPGPKYAETRHNAGFWFLDKLASEAGVSLKRSLRLHCDTVKTSLFGCDCVLARPRTFMNHSGQAVRSVMDYYGVEPESLLVAYDELDLSPGVARLKAGGGHGGHNGLRDIFRHLPDHGFLRLRIGIGHPGNKDAVTAYVLSRADAADEAAIRGSISEAVDVLPAVLAGDLGAAMKKLHTVSDHGI